MSTDTYFDFKSRDADRIERLEERAQSLFGAFTPKTVFDHAVKKALVAIEEARKLVDNYEWARVGYLYNFICDANLERWEALKEQVDGHVIDDWLIEDALPIWAAMYENRDRTPQNPQQDDILMVEQLRAVLEKYRGTYLHVRVD